MANMETRNPKRKEFVEAIVIRKEPVALSARIYGIPLRTAFNWLAWYCSGGWKALGSADIYRKRAEKVMNLREPV